MKLLARFLMVFSLWGTAAFVVSCPQISRAQTTQTAQTAQSTQTHATQPEIFSFLEGNASISFPAGNLAILDNDSLLVGRMVTSGIHKYYFRAYAIDEDHSPEEFLNITAKHRRERKQP